MGQQGIMSRGPLPLSIRNDQSEKGMTLPADLIWCSGREVLLTEAIAGSVGVINIGLKWGSTGSRLVERPPCR